MSIKDDLRDFIAIVVPLSTSPWLVWVLNIGNGELEHDAFSMALTISVMSFIILTIVFIVERIREHRSKAEFDRRHKLAVEEFKRNRGSLRW